MASNYTEHYQLPIWDPEDSFLREEFNETHQKIDDALAGLAKAIYVDTYDCTGTYGADNPITLTFPFRPKAVFIGSMNRTGFPGGWFAYGIEQVYVQYDTNLGGICYFTWNNNSVTFYSDKNASAQFNYSGQSICIALG